MANVRPVYTVHPALSFWRTRGHGGHTRLNDSWLNALNSDPDLEHCVVLVQLIFGGDVEVRVSTRECTVSSSTTGRTYQFQPVLGGDVTLNWQFTPGEPSSSAKSVTVTLPNEMVDAAAIIRESRILAGIAEISILPNSGEYDDRFVMVRGDLSSVEYDTVDQTLSCVVTDPLDSVDLALPPYKLTADRFSNIIESSVGQVLAVVFPSFGAIPAFAVNSSTSSPTFAVCYGHLTVDKVYIEGASYADTSAIYPWAQEHGIDDLGAPYTGVSFTGAGTGTFDGEGGEAVHVALSGGETNGSIVQVVRRLVENHTTLGIPGANSYLFGNAEAQAGYLSARCAANASGSGGVKALEFIEGTLLSSYPMISMVWWGGGYGPVYTNRRDRNPSWRLVSGQWPVIDRASSVAETPKSDCFNSFSIYYNYDPVEDDYLGYTERTPQNSALCELSRRITGERHHDSIESLFITSDQTAERVVDWLVDHRTLPAHDVTYTVSPGLVIQMMVGDKAVITDPDFGWEENSATVIGISFGLPDSSVVLRVWNAGVEVSGAAGIGLGTTSYLAPSGSG